jgi:RNA polymerase sigma-70 factor (ECF subfamily)
VAVYLADVEGFAYREIAAIMGSPVGTVMSRLHRGRSALRSSLAHYAERSGIIVASDGVTGSDGATDGDAREGAGHEMGEERA